MAITGAVIRNANVLNQFRRDLGNLAETVFRERRGRDVSTFVDALYRKVAIEGAYFVSAGYFGSPTPMPFTTGQGITDAGVGQFVWEMYPHQYATPRLSFDVRDERDSQMPIKARQVFEESADYLFRMHELVLAELLEGAATVFLHPETSFRSLQGSTGLYNSSHTYEGRSFDNIVTTSLTTTAQLIDAVYVAIERFDDALNTNGQPYWDARRSTGIRYVMLFPTALRQLLDATMRAELIVLGGTAPQSNYFKTVLGADVEAHVSQYLTNASRLHLFRIGESESERPLVYGTKVQPDGTEVRVEQWLNDTSDWSKETQRDGFRFIREFGCGIGNVLTAMRLGAA